MALCTVCKKNDAGYKCAKCAIDLCSECLKRVYVQETGPWCMSLGVSISQIQAGEKYLNVCEPCYEEAELL